MQQGLFHSGLLSSGLRASIKLGTSNGGEMHWCNVPLLTIIRLAFDASLANVAGYSTS